MFGKKYENTFLVREIEIDFVKNPKAVTIESDTVKSSYDAEKILRAVFPKDLLVRESFVALFFDNSNNLVGYYIISRGGITATLVDTRVLFSVALKCLAVGIILCHNHPSGKLEPSSADLSLTRRIKQGGDILDIKILDHIILSESGYYSFADNQIL